MLALVIAVTLSQCTMDTQCKGDRICVDGQCVDGPSRTGSLANTNGLLGEADRAARVHQLQNEIADLKQELEDSGWVAPVVKLAGGTAFAVVALVTFGSFQQANGCLAAGLSGCGSPSGYLSTAIASGALAVALFIWGGIQHRIRLAARDTLPREIESREAQLRILGVDPAGPPAAAPTPSVPAAAPSTEQSTVDEACLNGCSARFQTCTSSTPAATDCNELYQACRWACH
jgi:hypothetical protein